MKRLVIFILTLTIFVSTYGQEKSDEKATLNFKKIQIGINASTDFCSQIRKEKPDQPMPIDSLQTTDGDELFKIGYSGGLNAVFNINKRLGLETGIQYSNKGFRGKWLDSEESKIIFNYYFIDIPVKVNYTIGKKRVRFFTSAGMTISILTKQTLRKVLIYGGYTERETVETNFDLRKENISATLSAGIDCKINSKMNLRVEPTVRYGFLNILNSERWPSHLYSGGINVSYYIGF